MSNCLHYLHRGGDGETVQMEISKGVGACLDPLLGIQAIEAADFLDLIGLLALWADGECGGCHRLILLVVLYYNIMAGCKEQITPTGMLAFTRRAADGMGRGGLDVH